MAPKGAASEAVTEVEDPVSLPIPATPRAMVQEAIQQAKDDPQSIAKICVDVYHRGYQEGLKAGLTLERRPEKKKSWLD